MGEFEVAYDNVIADAERAAETTKTDAWHAMYQAFQEDVKTRAVHIAQDLDALAGNARIITFTEEVVKAIGDVKKRAADLAARIQAFERSTVGPMKVPFEQANECILIYQGRAAQAAEAEGMYAADIEDKMADSIAAKPKIRWNEKVGCIQIVTAPKPA